MGDCNSSKIAKMQLFHELKQQFPTLSDSIVKNCIKENGYDREVCARTLRATEKSRPSRGAFTPPVRKTEIGRSRAMSQGDVLTSSASTSHPHRLASCDFEFRRPSVNSARVPPINRHFSKSTPVLDSTKSESYSSQEVFDDSDSGGFELNVNVECSPTKKSGFGTPPRASRRSDSAYEPRNLYKEPFMNVNPEIQVDQTRGFTSVSLTLRQPSSDPQPPIDIRSQGSSLTYSTSSSDPRGFQSSVQISVAAARIRPSMAPTRPSSLIPSGQPPRPPTQSPRPAMTMSAPTTPAVAPINLVPPPSVPPINLLPPPSGSTINLVPTPSSSTTTSLVPQTIKSTPSTPEKNKSEVVSCSSNQLTETQRELIDEQLRRKNILAGDLKIDKEKLAALKKDVARLTKSLDPSTTPEAYKQSLEKGNAHLRNECKRLVNEIDLISHPGVGLGETNEEFYEHIYTGQRFHPRLQNLPPPLPAEPPAWQRPDSPTVQGEREQPPWDCRLCNYSNYYDLPICEICTLPRMESPPSSGETQDIHIRVTHHHNFSPRRTVHSWVV